MRSVATVAGISDHYGRAIWVCVSARNGWPVVVDRQQVGLLEPGLPASPYHHETLAMDLGEAERLVQQVQASADRYALKAMSKLKPGGAEINGIVLRTPPLPSLPESVAAAQTSYHVLTRADGMIYHHALTNAASAMGIPVELIPRGEESPRAAEVLGTTQERFEQWLKDLRGELGVPWQKDHREATARAIAVLGKDAKLKLP